MIIEDGPVNGPTIHVVRVYMLSIPFQSIHVVRVYSAILNEDCHVEMDRLILGTMATNFLSILIKY